LLGEKVEFGVAKGTNFYFWSLRQSKDELWKQTNLHQLGFFMPRRKTKKGPCFDLGEVGGAHASKVQSPLNDPTTLPWVSPLPKSFVALNSHTFQGEPGACCTPWWCHTSVRNGSGSHNPWNVTKTFTFTSAPRAQQLQARQRGGGGGLVAGLPWLLVITLEASM
jgi:hypothetical protein